MTAKTSVKATIEVRCSSVNILSSSTNHNQLITLSQSIATQCFKGLNFPIFLKTRPSFFVTYNVPSIILAWSFRTLACNLNPSSPVSREYRPVLPRTWTGEGDHSKEGQQGPSGGPVVSLQHHVLVPFENSYQAAKCSANRTVFFWTTNYIIDLDKLSLSYFRKPLSYPCTTKLINLIFIIKKEKKKHLAKV